MNQIADAAELKSCCAALYQSDLARILLGDSFHPGGQRLTRRMGEKLGLRPGLRVLDVASGKGASAIYLARRFGCHVIGVDFGARNVEESSVRAAAAGVADLISFVEGDAESLNFPDAIFDAVICECAFCTFPHKHLAAAEFRRVLCSGGGIGMSDLTRSVDLPAELEGLLAWIACIADARPVEEYTNCLAAAGFEMTLVEPHDSALVEMARDVQTRMLGVELMVKLGKLDMPGVDLDEARKMACAALTAIKQGSLGYSLIVARLRALEKKCS
jgi:SAM-dependent methyltransferase